MAARQHILLLCTFVLALAACVESKPTSTPTPFTLAIPSVQVLDSPTPTPGNAMPTPTPIMGSPPTVPPITLEDLAVGFMLRLTEREFDLAVSYFSEALADEFSPVALEQRWDEVLKQAGAYERMHEMHRLSDTSKETLVLSAHFAKATLEIRLTFSGTVITEVVFFGP